MDSITLQNLLVAAVPDLLAKSQFTDRNKVIGASEVGTCARLVVHRKLNETAIDPASAGRMLRGKALENVCVQIVREAMPAGAVRNTGQNQQELRHPTVPLVCHPDGEIRYGKRLQALEIKTADANAFRKYLKAGLPEWYWDQATVQAGLTEGAEGTTLVLVDAGNLGNIFVQDIPLEADRFQAMVDRTAMMAGHMAAETLPTGEPERAWGCSKCPIREDCEAYTLRMAEAPEGGLDPIAVADLTSLVDEIKALEDAVAEPAEELEAKKYQLKAALAKAGQEEFFAGPHRITLTPSGKKATLTLRLNWGD